MDHLTKKEIAKVKELFFSVCKDDGLTMEEVNTLLSRAKFGVQVTYQDLQKLFDEVDTADKGIIGFDGFIKIMSSLKKRDREEMSRTFTTFDMDGDGFITGEELHHVMSSLGESFTYKEIDAMIREADTDGDGRINFEEFAEMMTKK